MDVLQADKNDFCAELARVGGGLDAIAQCSAASKRAVRHDFVQIHAREIMHHFARGQILQQRSRLGVVVNPGDARS